MVVVGISVFGTLVEATTVVSSAMVDAVVVVGNTTSASGEKGPEVPVVEGWIVVGNCVLVDEVVVVGNCASSTAEVVGSVASGSVDTRVPLVCWSSAG